MIEDMNYSTIERLFFWRGVAFDVLVNEQNSTTHTSRYFKSIHV